MNPQLYGQSLWVRKHGGRVHRGHVRARNLRRIMNPPSFEDRNYGVAGRIDAAGSWSQGRLTQVSASSATSASHFSYSYLPNSDLLFQRATDNGLLTTYTYDSANRLTSVSNNVGATSVSRFLYELDSTGRRTKRTDADGSRIDYGYDSYDQLVSASKTNSPNSAADAAYNYAYQYDEVGNRLHEDRGKQDLDGTFNPLNQLTHLDFDGKLDVLGNVSGTNAPFAVKVDGEDAILYNSTNFLGGAELNPGHNAISIVAWEGTNATEIVRTVYTPPTNPQELTYDLNGNLTSDGYRSFTWNEENRLKEIETSPAATNMGIPKRRSTFFYDGLGRRASRTDYSSWNGSSYSTTNVTRFVWDGFNILAELTSSNTISSYMVWGQDLSQTLQGAGGVGGLLQMTKDGTNYFYTFDGNGNVTDVLDDQRNVVAHYEYDPYGRIVRQSGSFASENMWRYSTKMYDHWWGLVEFELRSTYSPNLGRFLSRDPIEERGGANLYLICRNNLINRWDFLGLQEVCTPWIWTWETEWRYTGKEQDRGFGVSP